MDFEVEVDRVLGTGLESWRDGTGPVDQGTGVASSELGKSKPVGMVLTSVETGNTGLGLAQTETGGASNGVGSTGKVAGCQRKPCLKANLSTKKYFESNNND